MHKNKIKIKRKFLKKKQNKIKKKLKNNKFKKKLKSLQIINF